MSIQDNINDYWTERAPSYDDYQQRPERRDVDIATWSQIWADVLAVTGPTGPTGPLDVLDVGTGSGQVACVVAGLGHRVTGIDLADGMLERARWHAESMPNPPTFLSGDAFAPDFPDGSFDAIVGRYVMWTLRDPADAVAHWIRLLRPGGTVAMVDSTWFPDGLDAASGENFVPAYNDDVRAVLPLAAATSIEDTAEVLRAGGLVDVTVTPLESILELDQQYGVAPDHDVQLQYLVTGRRPA